MTQQSDRPQTGNNNFLVAYGTAIFGFSILVLSLPDMNELFLRFWRVVLILSAVLGLLSLFPRPLKLIRSKIFNILLGGLVFFAWLFGFIVVWTTGSQEIPGSWSVNAFYIGYFWLFVILILLTRAFVVISEGKRVLNWHGCSTGT